MYFQVYLLYEGMYIVWYFILLIFLDLKTEVALCLMGACETNVASLVQRQLSTHTQLKKTLKH